MDEQWLSRGPLDLKIQKQLVMDSVSVYLFCIVYRMGLSFKTFLVTKHKIADLNSLKNRGNLLIHIIEKHSGGLAAGVS